MTIEEKRKLLHKLKEQCINQSKIYYTRYKRLKRKDDGIDVLTSVMTATTIALTISGFAVPPLLIASASLTGVSFVMAQAQKTYNLKKKYTHHAVCVSQYEALAREIVSVLHRNHMSSIEYDEFITVVNDKLALIDDSRLL